MNKSLMLWGIIFLVTFPILSRAENASDTFDLLNSKMYDCLQLSTKNEQDLSNIRESVLNRENSAIKKEESYYKSIKSVQDWILIMGGLLAFILGVAVVWGIKDMKSIKQNAYEIAKEEASHVAKKVAIEQADTTVNELIEKIYKDPLLNKTIENQEKLSVEFAEIKEEIVVLNSIVNNAGLTTGKQIRKNKITVPKNKIDKTREIRFD